MRQRAPSCVFHRHEVLDKSEYMCAYTQLTDILRALGHPGKQAEDGDVSSNPSISPSRLAIHESISMTASYAEYTSLTHCHTVEILTEEKVTSLWKHTIVFAAEQILNIASGGALRRGAVVMGAFITRKNAVGFTVSLMTQGTLRDQRVQSAVFQFAGQYTLTEMYAELPLCAAHRATRLRLWWEPRAERVTPHRVMPPIKVILEQQQQDDKGEKYTEERQLSGYVAVNIFLCRPGASHLRGSTRKLLRGAYGDATDEEVRAVPTLNNNKKKDGKELNSAAFLADEYSHGAARPKEQELWRRTVVLHFDDLSAVEEGEHLIGVEVEALPSYRAFVPALYGHLAPFLVVDQEDA